MGNLAGYGYRHLFKVLKAKGFTHHRQGPGSHEIWYNAQTDRYTTVPVHHGKDIPPGTLRHILKHAGISEEDFRRLRS